MQKKEKRLIWPLMTKAIFTSICVVLIIFPSLVGPNDYNDVDMQHINHMELAKKNCNDLCISTRYNDCMHLTIFYCLLYKDENECDL